MPGGFHHVVYFEHQKRNDINHYFQTGFVPIWTIPLTRIACPWFKPNAGEFSDLILATHRNLSPLTLQPPSSSPITPNLPYNPSMSLTLFVFHTFFPFSFYLSLASSNYFRPHWVHFVESWTKTISFLSTH